MDLSVGTPVDPTPVLIREALTAASDAPGYPATHGTARLRETVAAWYARAHGVTGLDPDAVLPSIGSKEAVAWLPTLLGIGPGDTVVIPELAYPTYEAGARFAGAAVARADDPRDMPTPAMVWLNSPSNPTGAVADSGLLASLVGWARDRGVILVADECYLDLGWDVIPRSLLHPSVGGGSHDGLLALHSLSKRSNLAGYRAGVLAGDPALVARLVLLRKHAGMIVPAPVQAAMIAAYADDGHVGEQRARYAARRESLAGALRGAGFELSDSAGGLYLWASHPGHADCWESVGMLAERGILVAPGEFYGPAGVRHVRVALTATDERVAAACSRVS